VGVLAGQSPDRSVQGFYEQAEPAVLRAGAPVRLFVGYWEGEPVAAAEAFLGGGIGGVYGVATVSPHRRKGIGTALTAQAVREAFDAGCRLVALQASPQGLGVYARLGFREACQFAVWQ
jgi:predicted GNAT family acetyltransferase